MPTQENYQRTEAVRTFLQDELNRYQAGELTSISQNGEVARKFGYTNAGGIYNALKGSGLIEARNMILRPGVRASDLISHEGAWIIGTLSGGGYVNLKNGRINLGSQEEEVLEAFQSTGERLFRQNSHRLTSTIQRGDTKFVRDYIEFHNVKTAKALGDLRKKTWDRTIREQHPWVLENDKYSWSFLEGFFETRGGIYEDGGIILLNCSSTTGVNFLSELLVRGGVKNPIIRPSRLTKEQVDGVMISNIPDIRTFTQNIHSKVANKEELLNDLRDRQDMSGRTRKYTDEYLIDEWNRIVDILGHPPKTNEFRDLLALGVTDVSLMSYARRFGNGSFVTARLTLERIN